MVLCRRYSGTSFGSVAVVAKSPTVAVSFGASSLASSAAASSSSSSSSSTELLLVGETVEVVVTLGLIRGTNPTLLNLSLVSSDAQSGWGPALLTTGASITALEVVSVVVAQTLTAGSSHTAAAAWNVPQVASKLWSSGSYEERVTLDFGDVVNHFVSGVSSDSDDVVTVTLTLFVPDLAGVVTSGDLFEVSATDLYVPRSSPAAAAAYTAC
jgi:hypothetical protein